MAGPLPNTSANSSVDFSSDEEEGKASHKCSPLDYSLDIRFRTGAKKARVSVDLKQGTPLPANLQTFVEDEKEYVISVCRKMHVYINGIRVPATFNVVDEDMFDDLETSLPPMSTPIVAKKSKPGESSGELVPYSKKRLVLGPNDTEEEFSDTDSNHSSSATADTLIAIQETPVVKSPAEIIQYLRLNFESDVTARVDEPTRKALVENREYAPHEGKAFCNARRNVEKLLLEALHSIWKGKGVPSVIVFRDILTTVLQKECPNLYRDYTEECVTAKGELLQLNCFRGLQTGGLVESIPLNLRQSYKRQYVDSFKTMLKNKRAKVPTVTMRRPEYGVVYDKLNTTEKFSTELLNEVNLMTEQERAVWIKSHPGHIHDMLRRLGPREWSNLKDFLCGPNYLIMQAEWLTSVPIRANVEARLDVYLDNLKLVFGNLSSDGAKLIKDTQKKADEHFNGSESLLHVELLRAYGAHYDKEPASIFRQATETDTESPHLKIVESRGQLSFDLYVNFAVILSKLDLCEAICAFLALCFCGHYQYPKKGEALGYLLATCYGQITDVVVEKKSARSRGQTKLRNFQERVGGHLMHRKRT